MASVTNVIKQTQQPRGGYLPIKNFTLASYNDGIILGEENISAALVGMAVDYLTRYILTNNIFEAFKISILGSKIIKDELNCAQLLYNVKGLDDKSIVSACKLVGYDVCYRSSVLKYKPISQINPDANTISNIRTMVKRSLAFFNTFGPITKDGFTFEGGYTDTVDAGDGDFLTDDTLWDFKVSSSPPNKNHTLQLLMYLILGRHSIHKEFNNIKKLGIFNPRLNHVYSIEIDTIPKEIINEVETNIIKYTNTPIESNPNTNPQKVLVKKSEKYLTVNEVAKKLRVTNKKVYSLINSGRLVAMMINKKYYIHQIDLKIYIDNQNKQKRVFYIVGTIYITLLLLLAILLLFTIFN